MDEQIAKEYLRENNDDFRNLFDQHKVYEKELEEYIRRRYLSEKDQFKEMELKKKKLILKDQMQLMINDYFLQPIRD